MLDTRWVRSFTSFLMVFAMVMATSSIALGFSDKNVMGEISVSGNSDGNGSFVLLNGEKAYNGRTFIAKGKIQTKDQPATIKLNNLGLIKIAPNTTLDLDLAADSIEGDLSNGKINVASNEGVKVGIDAAEGKISNDGTQKNVFDVDLTNGNGRVTSEVGTLTLDNGKEKVVVGAQDDDDDDDDGAGWIWVAFAGVVAVAAIVVFMNDDDDELQTISATF